MPGVCPKCRRRWYGDAFRPHACYCQGEKVEPIIVVDLTNEIGFALFGSPEYTNPASKGVARQKPRHLRSFSPDSWARTERGRVEDLPSRESAESD